MGEMVCHKPEVAGRTHPECSQRANAPYKNRGGFLGSATRKRHFRYYPQKLAPRIDAAMASNPAIGRVTIQAVAMPRRAVPRNCLPFLPFCPAAGPRSAERRVGEECRSSWSADHLKKN